MSSKSDKISIDIASRDRTKLSPILSAVVHDDDDDIHSGLFARQQLHNDQSNTKNKTSTNLLLAAVIILLIACFILTSLLVALYNSNRDALTSEKLLFSNRTEHDVSVTSSTASISDHKPAILKPTKIAPEAHVVSSFPLSIGQLLSNRAQSFPSLASNNAKYLRLSPNIQPEHYDVILKPFLPPPGTALGRQKAASASVDGLNFRLEGVCVIDIRIVESATREIHVHSEGLRIDTLRTTIVNSSHTVNVASAELMSEFDLLVIKTADFLVPCKNDTSSSTACTYRLTIPFAGKLSNYQELVGFYYGTYHHQPLSFDALDFGQDNMSATVDDANLRHFFAVTKLEPVYARRMMPCFDEPSFKSTFTLSVYTLENVYHVRSSMPVRNIRPVPETSSKRSLLLEHENIWRNLTNSTQYARRANTAWLQHARWVVYEFHTSPVMPVYTLAILVSSFESLQRPAYDGTPLAVWAPRDRVKYGAFALQAIDTCLWAYDTLFGISYRDMGIPKLDFVAVPQFQPGAMENWGLVTHHEQLLLFRSGIDTVKKQYHISGVICHEIVHQWFGNLVTLSWWSETWLNEGFASFFEYHGIDLLMPEWRRWQLFAWENIVRVLDSEDNNPGTYTTPPRTPTAPPTTEVAPQSLAASSRYGFTLSRRSPLYNPLVMSKRESVDSFQESTNPYKRGASVLLMMRTAIGQDNFISMLKQYLYDYRWKTVTTPILATYFDAFCNDTSCPAFRAGITPSLMLRSWTDSIGYPLINFTISSPSNTTSGKTQWTISQQRYIRKRSSSVSLFESLRFGSRYSTPPLSLAVTTTEPPHVVTSTVGNSHATASKFTSLTTASILDTLNSQDAFEKTTQISTTKDAPPSLLQLLQSMDVAAMLSARKPTTSGDLLTPQRTEHSNNSSTNAVNSNFSQAKPMDLFLDKIESVVKISIDQKPHKEEALWILPIRIMKADVTGRLPAVTETIWLTNISMPLPERLTPREEGEYVIADIDYSTLSRVDYPASNWRAIGKQLQHNPLRIQADARTKILVDAYAFIKHEQMPIELFLEIYRYLAKETHVPVLLAGWQNVHAFLGMYKMSSILTSLTGSLMSSTERTLRDEHDDDTVDNFSAQDAPDQIVVVSNTTTDDAVHNATVSPVKTTKQPSKRPADAESDDIFVYKAKTQIPREYGEFRYLMLEAAHTLFKRFGNEWRDVAQLSDSPLWRIIAQHISLDTICFFDAPQCAISATRLHNYIAQRRSYSSSWLCKQQYRRNMLGTDLSERLLCAAVANGGLTEWLYTYDELQQMIQYQTNTTLLWHDEMNAAKHNGNGLLHGNSSATTTTCRAIVTEQEMYAFKSALEMCTPRSSSAKLGMVSVFG